MTNKVSIFVHSCEGTTGVDDQLVKYLVGLNKIKTIIHIKFPFINSKNGGIKTVVYGKDIKRAESRVRFYKPEILSYLKDIVYSFIYGIKYATKSDIFISSPNILCVVGIFLKKIRLVKKTVYYLIDYSPTRYSNKILNKIYYSIDKFCCYGVDEVWSLNKEMIESRIADNCWDSDRIEFKVVPYGNNSDNLTRLDHEKHDRRKIVYFGGVYKNKGSELFVPLVKSLKKTLKDKFKVIVIGGGEYKTLRKEVRDNKLARYFKIYGPISSMDRVQKIMVKCGVGIAPYYPHDKNNFSYYADPGKIKDYLGCGLPVVITGVPPISKTIIKKGAGVCAKYDPSSFADSIRKVLGSDYKKYQSSSIKLGLEYSWNSIYNSLFRDLLR
jgi:glycosyltransferase involved in cell wall biosynthesis